MAFKFEALNLAHFKPSAATNNFSFESLLPKNELSQHADSSARNEFVKAKPRLLTILPANYHLMKADAGSVVRSDASSNVNQGSARLAVIKPEKKPSQDLFNAYKAVNDEVDRLFRGIPVDQQGRPTGPFKTGNPVDDLMAIRQQMHINNLRDGLKPNRFDDNQFDFGTSKKPKY